MPKGLSSFLSKSLLIGGISVLAAAVEGADFPPGMDWQRQQDYVKGQQEDEPSAATEEAPWHYSWGNASSDGWDINAAKPLIWQLTWFGHSHGAWAQGKDRLPLVEQKNLSIPLNPPKSTAACYVSWKNPSSRSVKVKVAATLKVSWHGGDGRSIEKTPLQIAVHTMGADGNPGIELFTHSATDSGDPQTEVTIDLSDVQLAPGDEIVFGFKGEELPGGSRYISVADDISIHLSSVVP